MEPLYIHLCGRPGDGVLASAYALIRTLARLGVRSGCDGDFPRAWKGSDRVLVRVRIDRPNSADTTGRRLEALPDTCFAAAFPGPADVLVSLHDPAAIADFENLRDGGLVIYDDHPPDYREEDAALAGFVGPFMTGLGLPLRDTARRVGGSKRYRNAVALGALARCLGLPLTGLGDSWREGRPEDPPEDIATAVALLQEGYEMAGQDADGPRPPRFALGSLPAGERLFALTGAEALVSGLLAGAAAGSVADSAAAAPPLARVFGYSAPAIGEILALFSRLGQDRVAVDLQPNPACAVARALGQAWGESRSPGDKAAFRSLAVAVVATEELAATSGLLESACREKCPLVVLSVPAPAPPWRPTGGPLFLLNDKACSPLAESASNGRVGLILETPGSVAECLEKGSQLSAAVRARGLCALVQLPRSLVLGMEAVSAVSSAAPSVAAT